MTSTDFIVIGAGIAGASAASALAQHGRVVVLEMEERPAYHSTGRSAAYFAPGYGNEAVRRLTTCAEQFFLRQPDGFGEVAVFRRRDWLHIAREDQMASLDAMASELGDAVDAMSVADIETRVPILRRGYVAGGLIDRRGGDLDVDALLQGHLRLLRRRDGKVVCDARVSALVRSNGLWTATTPAGSFSAPVIVNAAGAWADEVAQLAGLGAIGIEPKRRTAILVPAPTGHNSRDWPLTVDIDEDFYFKPDAGAILISPADETPSPPCDAQPDDLDVAYAVDRFERATTLEVRRVSHKWAGLRVFAPDRTPIAGFDPRTQGFFWLAGQGGYGVQTSPAMSAFAASAIAKTAPPAGMEDLLALAPLLSPARLMT